MTSFSARLPGTRRVLIIAFPGALLLDIAGPAQVFEAASRITAARGDGAAYTIVLASLEGGSISTDTGIVLDTVGREGLARADTLVIPGGLAVLDHVPRSSLLDWIRTEAGRARRTASVCLGAFLLAEAGLLHGRRVSTHWRYCETLQRLYPKLRVEPESIFVQDGSVWTSAGVSAGIDLALALVEEDLGHSVALEVAQRLVVFLKRPGGQAQFSCALAAQSADRGGRFEALHAWATENLAGDLRVERLAEQAGMSPRSFARLYAHHTGQTPARFIASLRLEAARRLLTEQPDLSVVLIARRCGFGDDERMRRAFLRAFGVPPSAYRQRFGSVQADPPAA